MFDEQDGKSMNKNVKNALITIALLTALGGGLFYSTLDRKQETASRTAIADETPGWVGELSALGAGEGAVCAGSRHWA